MFERAPERTLPRILVGAIAITVVVYLLVNAAFLHVLPFGAIARSKLVAADVAVAILGPRGGAIVAGLALVVVLAAISGVILVTPRVLFAIARDGLGPAALARVNRGGTPWVATLVVGVVAAALAITGTFERLFGIAIMLVLVADLAAALALLRLRRAGAAGPAPAFRVPALPVVAGGYLVVYAALFVVSVVGDPVLAIASAGTVAVAAVGAVVATRRAARRARG